jgi:DNA adenine methylase
MVVAVIADDEERFDFGFHSYAGRHVDYFNSWSAEDEATLVSGLQQLEGKFILSTWHSNEFRRNPLLEYHWNDNRFHLFTKEHYYHVGSSEALRHPVLEALITNFAQNGRPAAKPEYTQLTLLERTFNDYAVG